jgi:hypothetical protein
MRLNMAFGQLGIAHSVPEAWHPGCDERNKARVSSASNSCFGTILVDEFNRQGTGIRIAG